MVGAALGSAAVVAAVAVSQARPLLPIATTSGGKISSHVTGIKYTSKTVVIPNSTVKHDLVGISAAGVFKFKHASGPLGKLKPGRVMLLQGSDALLVTKVSHSGADLLVHTTAATLTQVLRSGKITFTGAPNFRTAFVAPTISSGGGKAADAFHAPDYPYVGSAPQAHTAGAPSFSIQGSAGNFGYSLSLTPSSPTKLDVAGVICFQWGSICSNGPSNGLSLEINISGYIDFGNESGSVSVNGGRITGSTFGLQAMHAHLKFNYTAARGTGPDSGGDPPVFHIPIGIDYPILVGEIPIYTKLQTAILVKLGMSSKNTVIRGGVEYDSSSSESIKVGGKSESGSGTGGNPAGQFLTGEPTVALGAGGVVVAVQFPKIGVGLGVRAANVIGYVDMITSMGQTAAGALSLVPGCEYNLAWSIGGGFESQLGFLGFATPRKILVPTSGMQYEHTIKEPTC
jgi:hypothetical protein